MDWQGPKKVSHPNTGSERLNLLEVAWHFLGEVEFGADIRGETPRGGLRSSLDMSEKWQNEKRNIGVSLGGRSSLCRGRSSKKNFELMKLHSVVYAVTGKRMGHGRGDLAPSLYIPSGFYEV